MLRAEKRRIERAAAKGDQKPEMILPFETHIKNLILKTEEEMVNMQIQEWVFFKESLNPVHIGKAEAEDKMVTYQKRARYCQENLHVYRMYCEEHNIQLWVYLKN